MIWLAFLLAVGDSQPTSFLCSDWDVAKNTGKGLPLVIASPFGFQQGSDSRLVVDDRGSFLNGSQLTTFSWHKDENGRPFISLLSDESEKSARHIVLLKQRVDDPRLFTGVAGIVNGPEPDRRYFVCMMHQGDAATKLIDAITKNRERSVR